MEIAVEPKKKFLCICEGGNVRSVAMARTLKDNFKQNAVAMSWACNDNVILEFAASWADYILLMQPKFIERLSDKLKLENGHKIRIVDVGPDRFGTASHPELYEFVSKVAQGWSYQKWVIPKEQQP